MAATRAPVSGQQPPDSTAHSHAVRLSVVLPTVRAWPEIAEPLAASLRQDFDEPYEVLVVDGHGAGLEREPDLPVRWIRQPGADVFDLRAAGVAAARGDIILFGEDHCIAGPQWYSRTSAAHRSNAAPILIGSVGNHPESSNRAADRASFALTLGPFAPPLVAVPAWRLPVPTNLSVKRSCLPATCPPQGWIEYDLLADAMARGAIGIAPDAHVDHLQRWGPLAAMAIHFQSGRSYGAAVKQWNATRKREWWRNLPKQAPQLYRLTVPVIDRDAAGARSSNADRWWLAALIAANLTGQITGVVRGAGASRRQLV